MEAKKRNIPSPLIEYARFGITGILNTATDLLVLNGLLTATGGQGGLYIASKSISFLAAVTQSYFLNKYWVFGANSRTSPHEGRKFFAVSIAGFLLNIAGSSLVFSLLSALDLFDFRTRANVGAIFGTALVLAWNYIGYKFFVFKAVNIKQP